MIKTNSLRWTLVAACVLIAVLIVVGYTSSTLTRPHVVHTKTLPILPGKIVSVDILEIKKIIAVNLYNVGCVRIGSQVLCFVNVEEQWDELLLPAQGYSGYLVKVKALNVGNVAAWISFELKTASGKRIAPFQNFVETPIVKVPIKVFQSAVFVDALKLHSSLSLRPGTSDVAILLFAVPKNDKPQELIAIVRFATGKTIKIILPLHDWSAT